MSLRANFYGFSMSDFQSMINLSDLNRKKNIQNSLENTITEHYKKLANLNKDQEEKLLLQSKERITEANIYLRLLLDGLIDYKDSDQMFQIEDSECFLLMQKLINDDKFVENETLISTIFYVIEKNTNFFSADNKDGYLSEDLGIYYQKFYKNFAINGRPLFGAKFETSWSYYSYMEKNEVKNFLKLIELEDTGKAAKSKLLKNILNKEKCINWLKTIEKQSLDIFIRIS